MGARHPRAAPCHRMARFSPTGSPALVASSWGVMASVSEVDRGGAGSMSCTKVKRVRVGLGSRKRKVSLIKNNVSRDYDLASGNVKAPIDLMGRRVTEKDTRRRARR